MAEEKTLREHAAPQVNQAPLCIATPMLQAPLELKSSLILLLPKFRWLMNEDPYQHLKEFHVSRPQAPSSSQQPSSSRSDSSLEDIVKSLALNTQQFQNETRQNVSAINLRSGKELEEPIRKRSCGRDLGAESKPETKVLMMKPGEGVQNEEKSNPFDGTLHQQDKLNNVLSESIDQVRLDNPKEDPNNDEVQEEVVYELEALKPKLVQVKEEKLVQILREYKEAVAHMKDLSLSTCMQRNPLGVNYDPIQEVQRHLSPPRMEVFKKEFQKLLHTDMIYLNSNSKWVNQLQVTLNEIGTMVGNSKWVDYVVPKPPDNE
ncbi:DNA-directed DNA polymerase [Senna tora]|uniref:DNA-directed DNA polymerase n=1 Tax=Senna tora TaxID=362788 RepID=A0A834SYA3_9FABA|nr:DNA-directed DNA polymerase [Senna tora]